MEYRAVNSGFGYVIRLKRGEQVISSLRQLAETEEIKGAFFYGLGALENTTIGRWDLEKKEYYFTDIPNAMELASLNGSVSTRDGKFLVHAHAVLGDGEQFVCAGHVKEGTVAVTCEIFMHLIHGTSMERVHDEEVGLPLLTFL